jgi:DNA polymerase type B, organellar and viral
MRQDRAAHWVKHNQQERMPSRMVAFDTESRSRRDRKVESQSWRMACAIRWRTDLSTGDRAESGVFLDPAHLWSWVASFCRSGTRTVVWCHNLGYDCRISQVFTILPELGFRLEWCNLDRNVSSMTWRSDNGTLVFADTWTWLPMDLESIAPQAGLVKYEIPEGNVPISEWSRYCFRDTEIVYHVVSRLVKFIKYNNLGNWQPTGAGMSMAVWRHRFLSHKILVHDDKVVLSAEREAMYTGRAEAWRHGKLGVSIWTEVDLRNAYLRIASECKLPRKLHMSTRSIDARQYRKLRERFSLLCYCTVDTTVPVMPCRNGGGILWPVGRFSGWYWDCEIDSAIESGAKIKIHRSHVYVEDYILKEWADWVIGILHKDNDDVDPVVRTWIKHCSRALIGRLALRTPYWEPWGSNPECITGITYVTIPSESRTTRMLHVGDTTLMEMSRDEGRDSLPQVTGKIMALCRTRLWRMMNVAGLDNIAHVDTDSVLCNVNGLYNLRTVFGDSFQERFAIKGSYKTLDVYGPRRYRRDGTRVAAGIPRRATETSADRFEGERWASLSSDLSESSGAVVSLRPATWTMTRADPRRRSAGIGSTATTAYEVWSSTSMPSRDGGATADGS